MKRHFGLSPPSEDESVAGTAALAVLGVGMIVGAILILCQLAGIVVQ